MTTDQLAPLSPIERMAAAALMEHGDYYEGADSIEWLWAEAQDLARLNDEDEIVALLADTAWWDPTTETDERVRRCARAFLSHALTT